MNLKKNFLTTILLTFVTVSTIITGCGSTSSASSQINASGNSSKTSSSSKELQEVRVAQYSNYITDFTQLIDEKYHIYEKHGIKSVGTTFSMGVDSMNALSTGSLDIGFVADYAGLNRLGSSKGDTDLRIIAQLSDYAPMNLWTSSDIKKPKDLEGKAVITINGTIYDYLYAKLFDAYGIDKSKVKILSVTSTMEALALAKNKEGYAYWVQANEEKKFEQYGWGKLLSSSEYDTGRFQLAVANNTWLKEHNDAAVKWLQATQELIDYMYAHEDEVAGLVKEKYGINEDQFKQQIHDQNYGISFSQNAFDKSEELNEWLYENKFYDKKYNLKDYINITAVKEAFPDKVDITE